MTTFAPEPNEIPIFLLKTKSVPHDGYQEFFENASLKKRKYAPLFVPVLEHELRDAGLDTVRQSLKGKKINASGEAESYGGMIFTSQRAVEAFARLAAEGSQAQESSENPWPHLSDVPIYTVGPATSKALRSIPTTHPLNIFGEECGTGEVLSHYMLDHYSKWHRTLQQMTGRLPPILFCVGETRRDIIPKTLMNPELEGKDRIEVNEVEVYGTGVMESFEEDFLEVLDKTRESKMRWVVVFSPTGCEAALRALGTLDPVTKMVKERDERPAYHEDEKKPVGSVQNPPDDPETVIKAVQADAEGGKTGDERPLYHGDEKKPVGSVQNPPDDPEQMIKAVQAAAEGDVEQDDDERPAYHEDEKRPVGSVQNPPDDPEELIKEFQAVAEGEAGKRKTFIATIGPTTRDYLINEFGYIPDVCASKPSPEGVGEAITEFMASLVV